ncbi:MAG TPA: potassium transporter TrkG [Planctomycetota bacterium]|nr:potassium transporter TrkG [Planctomycetota bacterium]
MFRSRLDPQDDSHTLQPWYWRWIRLRHQLTKPYFLLAVTFAFAIAVGAELLALPFCTVAGSISQHDAWFTSTSAICVTGLTTRPTSTFTFWGQLVIVVLIQLGGIGIMTLSTIFFLGLRKKATLYEQGYLREFYGADVSNNLPRVVLRVMTYILSIEGLGALLLFARVVSAKSGEVGWSGHVFRSAWWAIFHSVSAFCNAGFGLEDDNLMGYADDSLVNVVVMGLIVSGGLGFFVLADLHQRWLTWRRRETAKLRFQSRMVLFLTAFLILFGAAVLWGLERSNAASLANRSWHESTWVCFFQSVTCRTAGFNTIDLNLLTPASILLLMILMFIGAAPGGTGGGIKVTTFGVLLAQMMFSISPRREPGVMGRAFARTTIRNAVALTVCALGLMVVGTGLVVAFQHEGPSSTAQGLFLDSLFEVISAQGTVGLSLGLTSHLEIGSKWVIIVMMFLGRIGPWGMFSAALEHDEYAVEYPFESVNIG